MRRLVLAVTVGALVALGTSGIGTAGAVEQPVARIVFEFSCNGTDDPFCAPDYFGFRYTATLWPDGEATIQGSFNEHTRGGTGGSGEPLRDVVEWTATTGPLNLATAEDPSNLYFNLGVGTLSFPQTAGHYLYQPMPGTQGIVIVIR